MARGHVRRRGKGWVYVLRHPALDKPEWSRQVPTEAEAEQALTARLASLDLGQGVFTNRETVAVYLRAWLAGRANIRASTRLAYEREIEKHIIPFIGELPLAKLKPEQIAAWQNVLRKTGLSEGAIAYARTVLTIGLRQAVRWGHIPRNPADLVERPQRAEREHHWWEPEEARRFLDATAETDHGALYRLALAGLLRRGELLALKWDDIDVERRRVTVRRTVTRSGIKGQPWTTGLPKGGKLRAVIVDPDTIAALLRHRERQAFRRANPRWVDGGLVFPNRDGGLIGFERGRLRFRDDCLAAGVPVIRFHDLRHTGATLLLRGGVPLKVVSEMLGHANISITGDLYLHVSETMQDEASNVMGKMLGGA